MERRDIVCEVADPNREARFHPYCDRMPLDGIHFRCRNCGLEFDDGFSACLMDCEVSLAIAEGIKEIDRDEFD